VFGVYPPVCGARLKSCRAGREYANIRLLGFRHLDPDINQHCTFSFPNPRGASAPLKANSINRREYIMPGFLNAREKLHKKSYIFLDV